MKHVREASRSYPRQRLTEARTQRGWSQQEVAGHIGTTAINVSRWERGLTRPGPYFRSKLCALFGKSEQDLELLAEWDVSAEIHSTTFGVVFDPAIPLPSPMGLVGRDRELKQLKQRLRTGGTIALSALNGLPGVGKTALAIELVHDQDIHAHFSDGILWAALGPEPNLSGLLSRWGTMLGISSTEAANGGDSEAWAIALRRTIGTRSMLLVIDDAWRLEDVLALKVGGPNCVHLVTTRLPRIATAIAVGGATILHELENNDGITLLRTLAPGVIEHDGQRAHELVKAVGGLPLALTLMGNYLRMQAYSGQARRIVSAFKHLSDAEERLQISEPLAPAEQHPSLPAGASLSLESVLAVTDKQLDEQARAVFYALSVFPSKPNSFSEEAALAIADCAVDVLDALFDAGLLESSVSGRYTMHQTIADYARLHLHDATTYERFIIHFTTFAEIHKKDYELLEQESNLILAALEIAYKMGRLEPLVRCTCSFAPFLLVRGIYTVAEQHLQRAYDAAMVLGDSIAITSILLYLGEVAQNQGNYEQAVTYWQEGLALAREIGDSERSSALLNDLGWVMWKRGEYEEAEAYLQEGLMTARERDDKKRISGLLKVLGSVVGSRGDYVQEIAYLQEGLAIARQIGDQEQICAILINLGVTAGEQGDYVQAEAYFQEGLAIARQIGGGELMSVLLSNLGETAGAQGSHAQAEAYFQEGLAIARQIEHHEWISVLLSNLGLTRWKQGNNIQAQEYFQQGLSTARRVGRPQITANILYEYGNFCLDQQQIEKAEAIFREVLTTIREGDQDLIALAYFGLARVEAQKGHIQEARKLGRASLSSLETLGHRNARQVKDWLASLEF